MSEVTIICCYNNEKVYDEFVNTLKTQTCPYELIGIDNRSNGKFTSCAAAYNSVIDEVKTKYVIYSHQDILLQEPEWLNTFVSFLHGIGRDDILGVAGARFDSEKGIANILQIDKQTGKVIPGNVSLSEAVVQECDTVDECLFSGYTEHFREYRFDEVICDDWHLYAAEQCLRTKSIKPNSGHVMACNIPVVHISNGTISPAFRYGFYKMCRKYSALFPFVKTMSGAERTDFIHLFPRFIYLWAHSMVGVIFRKMGIYDTMKKIFH